MDIFSKGIVMLAILLLSAGIPIAILAFSTSKIEIDWMAPNNNYGNVDKLRELKRGYENLLKVENETLIEPDMCVTNALLCDMVHGVLEDLCAKPDLSRVACKEP